MFRPSILLLVLWICSPLPLIQGQELPTVYEYFTEGGITSGLLADTTIFQLNGKSVRIISGAIHYFRIHPSQWRDSLKKLRASGANTVETYIPWNLHEPRRDEFDFGDGANDFSEFMQVVKFIQMAQEEDLLVLLRPGPFICAEWEYGGFPSWLLTDYQMKVRGDYGPYLERLGIYFDQLLPLLQPLQFVLGGPIIAIQLENEYANYWPISKVYLQFMETKYKTLGFEKTLLYTSDNSPKGDIGSLPNLLKTANFREDPVMNLNKLIEFQPDKPPMVMEFWTGWFDPWFATTHETWSPEKFETNLDIILGPQFNASVNFYVFHGGTNFGFMAGGVYNGNYKPLVTSYDYDAPLSEAGLYTAKYWVIQKMTEKYGHPKLYRPPAPNDKTIVSYDTIVPQVYLTYDQFMAQVPATSKFVMDYTTSMEYLPMNGGSGQSYGYVVFSKLLNIKNGALFKAGSVQDFGTVVVDGKVQSSSFAGTDNSRYWINDEREIALNVDWEGEHQVDLVVEEMARVNVGSEAQMLAQRKGLLNGHINLDGSQVTGFNVTALEFKGEWVKNLNNFQVVENMENLQAPLIVQSTFDITGEPKATYLDLDGWHKGLAFINGFNLGRYFKVGPQRRLYVPEGILKTGENIITIFEQLEPGREIKFSMTPDLGR